MALTTSRQLTGPAVPLVLWIRVTPSWFSGILAEAFLQIPIRPEDRRKTAFCNLTCKLEYTSGMWRGVLAAPRAGAAAGVEADPAKIEAVQRWPLPLYTRAELQKILGLASYYRNSIPGFARIAALPGDLLTKDKEFIWTENEDEAPDASSDT
ncbi:uncharacterized protein EMH_0028120 [Eimeria mitis]|uniref:Uncharacterized protein n=1 Tax=Eimeria mitis TaxID=44415 RepID=U6KH96_9EIME|nr:uncharacterized protein EMH_0028120 [Eimeria mitis]CDJ35647.1 hypothetical protein EMH_0028120 [Eimeria mitis]